MEKLKSFEKFDSINENRDMMISVIRNILKEIYQNDNESSIEEVINHFADKLFINDEDKSSFHRSIIG
jgi:hypothetical protein